MRRFLLVLSCILSSSCEYREVISYFVEYRVDDPAMGAVYDADPSTEAGYARVQHNRYQTVNWGLDAKPVVAVPEAGYVFDHWEKYVVVVTESDFVMTLVSRNDGNTATRYEKRLYDNLILVACFTEAVV